MYAAVVAAGLRADNPAIGIRAPRGIPRAQAAHNARWWATSLYAARITE